MGGVAALAQAAGYRVTGCDANVYPPMSDQLRALGIELIEGFDASQHNIKPDVWVVGNVVSRGNPLMEAILDAGDDYVSGPQWLADSLLRHRWVMAVAGTHGKTTTASMLAWILEAADKQPGFLIGGVPANFSVSARAGQSPLFVIEADEYDTAFFDKRSKFVHYRPKTAILNNLEFDHADIFDHLADIERQFHHLVRTVPRAGQLVVNARDAALERVLARGTWSSVVTFGDAAGWSIQTQAQSNDGQVFYAGNAVGMLRWQQLGEHNQMNALAAIAAAAHAGVSPQQAIEALSDFSGVKRRMERRGTVQGVTVYDDFAHHPTAIQTTIEGLRHQVGRARILAVLEPRSNTMKLGTMKAALPKSVQAADRVFVYGKDLGWNAREVFQPLGDGVVCAQELEQLINAIVHEARDGDHVLVMSNGGFGGIHTKLLERLGKQTR